jgi:hypothetical protein
MRSSWLGTPPPVAPDVFTIDEKYFFNTELFNFKTILSQGCPYYKDKHKFQLSNGFNAFSSIATFIDREEDQ